MSTALLRTDKCLQGTSCIAAEAISTAKQNSGQIEAHVCHRQISQAIITQNPHFVSCHQMQQPPPPPPPPPPSLMGFPLMLDLELPDALI